ncbi:MAG: hypothetical protein ACE37F_27220 [Nannocystaceae bacterium]|nr:hypothetical protein [bacterium]
MTAEHLPGPKRRLRAHSPRAQAVGFLVFIALMLGLQFPYFEQTRNANELPRIMAAMARVDTGVWAIDGPGGRRLRPGPDVSRSRVDGRIYPNKPPGTTVVIALGYRLARVVHGDALTLAQLTWWARLVSGWLPTLVLAGFLVRRLAGQFSRGPAIAAVAVYALATPAASYAHLAYGHQLAAALLCIGAVLCVDAARAGPEVDARVVWAKAIGGGALAGAAVTVEYGAVFAGVPLGVFLLWNARTRGRLATTLGALLGALLPIAWLGVYHRTVYGAVLSTGYHHVTNPDFALKHGQGFLGLSLPSAQGFATHVLDPGGGLLWWAPLVPLALYGLFKAASHPDDPVRSFARVSLATVLLYLAIVSGLSFTGGWRVGPRYLVAVLPMLAWGWAEALGQIRNRPGWIALVYAALLYALVVNALAANLWPHLDLTNVNHPVPEVLFALWSEGVEPYGVLWSAFHLDTARAVIAISVVGGLLAVVRVVEPSVKTYAAVAAGLLLGALALASVTRWEPHPKARRNLAYILRAWEPHVEPQLRRPSKGLPALAEGVRDEGPRRKPAMIPPR